MMATTHVLAGLIVASIVSVFAPDLTVAAVVGGIVGGVFPDLDLYAGHRKTLHFPVYYSVATLPVCLFALFVPSTITVGAATFLVAAALHATGDVFGGGLELRPWHGTSTRAVFNHRHGRWIAPKRWIRYDGAPEDLGLAILFALPSIVVFDGYVENVVVLCLAISVGYVAVRKPLVRVAEYAVEYLPSAVCTYLPDRLLVP